MRDPPFINHDPNETPRPRSWYWDRGGVYWIAWAAVAFGWAHQLYFNSLDWQQILLGVGTGAVLVASAINYTGNRLWHGEPPSR